MARTIMLVLIGKRRESAVAVQKVLTDYGCYIKTRLGLHEASETVCSEEGLLFMELIGESEKHQELFGRLKEIKCVSVRLEDMSVESCG